MVLSSRSAWRQQPDPPDRELGVNDALSTSLQFTDLSGVFGDDIRVRADSVVSSSAARSAIPLRIRWRPLASAAAASLAALCVVLFTDPAERTVSIQDAERAALEVQADRLRARAKELLSEPSVSEDQAELSSQLDQLASQLEEAPGLNAGLSRFGTGAQRG